VVVVLKAGMLPGPGFGGQPVEPTAPNGGSVNGSGVIFAGARPEISPSPGLFSRGRARLLVPVNAWFAATERKALSATVGANLL